MKNLVFLFARRLRKTGLSVLLLPVFAGCMACAADSASAMEPVSLNVGFIRTCFLNVNQAEAEAAFKVLAATVGRQRGYEVTAHTQIFETPGEIESAIKNGAINLAIVDSWKYLAMEMGASMKPRFVTSEQGQVGKKYLLLTRRGSGLNSLADLQGKELLELEVANSNAGRAWLDTLLLQNHCGDPTNFFGGINFASKPALVVLPVFFGKKPACLIDHFSFNLMSELNPQVAKEIQVVATSEAFVDNVVCMSDTGWPSEKVKTDLLEILADLQNEPAGQQILTLFKVGPMIPFDEKQLDTVRELRARQEALRKSPQNQSAAAAGISSAGK